MMRLAAAQQRAPARKGYLLLWLAGVFVSAGEIQAKDSSLGGDLPLPRWSEREIQSFREQGSLHGAILPNTGDISTDVDGLLNGPRLEHSFSAENGRISSRLRPEDMALFLPESTLVTIAPSNTHAKSVPTPLVTLRDVSPEFFALAEQSPAQTYLIDPGQLVPETQQYAMARFLEFHARDAGIKLYLLIVPHNQKLPDQSNLSGIASGGLSRMDSCLVIYPLGEPWRARMFLSKTVHEQTSSEFLTETLQACLAEAMLSSDAFDQMHRYAVQLSTRLFWLRKALISHPKSDRDSILAEVTGGLESRNHGIILQELAWGCTILTALLASLWFLVRGASRFWRARSQNTIWILPDPEISHRLGGTFTGGGGGVHRYS